MTLCGPASHSLMNQSVALEHLNDRKNILARYGPSEQVQRYPLRPSRTFASIERRLVTRPTAITNGTVDFICDVLLNRRDARHHCIWMIGWEGFRPEVHLTLRGVNQ